MIEKVKAENKNKLNHAHDVIEKKETIQKVISANEKLKSEEKPQNLQSNSPLRHQQTYLLPITFLL